VQNEQVVYLVGEDPAVTEPLTTLLEDSAIHVRAFPDAERFLRDEGPDPGTNGCVLSAQELPGMDGLSLVRQIRAHNACLPVIVMTETVDPELNRQAVGLGATDVIERPLVKAYLTHRSIRVARPTATRSPGADVTAAPSDEREIMFRAIGPGDADIEQAFVRGLSDISKNLRFFSAMKQLSPQLLEQFTHPNFPGDYALIATSSDDGSEREIGVARYLPTETPGVAEFAVVVADAWQGLGIASRLMHGVICVAAVAGVRRLEGVILRGNSRMLRLARKLGFATLGNSGDPATVRVSKTLGCPLAS
tara:strand:- start:5264 stop:6181 length:918 start_codon:yes stop_codon:yes gene_type:complete